MRCPVIEALQNRLHNTCRSDHNDMGVVVRAAGLHGVGVTVRTLLQGVVDIVQACEVTVDLRLEQCSPEVS